MTNVQIGKIQAEQFNYDERKHAKDIAQFQRQMTARVNQRKYSEEIGQEGMEVLQQAEDILRTKGLVEAIITSITAASTTTMEQWISLKGTEQTENMQKITRAKRRAAAKRAWYKRKKINKSEEPTSPTYK